MRTFLLFTLAVVALYAQPGAQTDAQSNPDVVMNAMRDEMARSMKQLTVENLEKPYFISYRVVDADTTSVMSAFGALNHSNYNHSRRLTVEVRVGDYKLDSSHLFSFDMDFGTQLRTFNGTAELPLADDYKEIRRQIWIATDNTYKKAVEDLSKKRGLLQTRSREDESDDFSKEDPQVSSDEIPAVKVNVAEWERETRALSALFRTMPGIYTSSVLFNCFNTYTRYLTSEGTSYTRRQPTIAFTIGAATQAADGLPLEDLVWATGRSLAEMPRETELAGRLQTMAHHLTEVREAPTLDNYNGPILVEGDAALMLFRASFIPSLVAVKQTISGLPGGMRANQNQTENPFLDKIGARVLPDFLSLTDNPGIHEYQNRHLAAFSKFDEDGMPSREVKIVENGVLKTLLASRDPVRGIDHTTGSRHAGQATPSNLIVTVSNGLSTEDLHARFIELVKQRNGPFGMVVRKLRNNAGPLNVLLAYKCFPDGHEELVRGMQLFGFSVQSFKDIVAASRDLNFATLRYQPPAGQFFMPNESEENFTPISLLVPSVLLEDATMRKIRAASPNPPVSGPPFFEK